MISLGVDCITKYFPHLSAIQMSQFGEMQELYEDWNANINVISRKDIQQLYLRHVLHSLGISKVQAFLPGSTVLDVGTGGGFPGIPLAILYPESDFLLVDSVAKKIKVVNEMATSLRLKNVKGMSIRAEEVKGRFDFIVSRAVTQMQRFYPWVQDKFKPHSKHQLKNGILYLKGGSLSEELAVLQKPYQLYALADFFEEDFFETKKVVYIPAV